MASNPYVNRVVYDGNTLIDISEDTVDSEYLLNGYTAHKKDGSQITGAVVTAPASDASPNMDGTASAGSASTYSRGDHTHPTDTTRQVKITANGILKGDGSGGITAAVSGTDYQAPLPSQTGNEGKFLTTDGTTVSWADVDEGGSTVSYTPVLSSGTKGGTITIDGTDNDIYAPTDTDTKVTQTKVTYSSYAYWRPVTIGSSTSSTVTGAFSTTTNNEYVFDNLRYQPSTGTLRTKVYNISPTAAGTTASNNQMTSDGTDNIYFKVNNGANIIMTLYSNGTDMQVRPGADYDNQVDLGKSTVRWKDAYLSGTVNAANYAGDITATTTVASGDKIIVHDASASNVAGGITLGTSTTQYLANDGSWQNIPSSGTQVSLVDWTVSDGGGTGE